METGITLPEAANILVTFTRMLRNLIERWLETGNETDAERVRDMTSNIIDRIGTGIPAVSGKFRFVPDNPESSLMTFLELDAPVTLEFNRLYEIDVMLETGSDEMARGTIAFCEAFRSAMYVIKKKFDDEIDRVKESIFAALSRNL